MKLRNSTLRRRALGRAAAAAVAAGSLFALASCGAGGTDATSTSTETGTDESGDAAPATGNLTVVVEGGGKIELEPIAEKWKEETGNSVTFVELPYDGLFDRISTELASGNVSFDVAALDAIWLPAFGDGVQALDDMFTDEVRADLFPALIEEATYNGSLIGMPAWTNAEILYYRTDLFEDTAQQEAFTAEYGYDLIPPTTWQEFEDVAKFFTQDTDGDGEIDLYGTDVKGAVETEWLATVLQAGASGMVLDVDGNVIVNDAAHKAALDWYTKLYLEDQVSPPGAAQIDWAAAQNLFNQGQTAMMRFWGHAYRGIPEDAPVFGKTGVTTMPAGEAGIAAVPGAWYLSVPTATENSALAMEFIQYAYDNNKLSLETGLGLGARKSALEEFSTKPGFENLAPLVATLDAPATQARPANAKWQQIVDTALVPMLQKSLEEGADNQALLDDAAKQIEDIIG